MRKCRCSARIPILIFPLPGGANEVGCEVDYRHYPHKEHEKGR